MRRKKSSAERTRRWRERDGDYVVLPIEAHREALKHFLLRRKILRPLDLLDGEREALRRAYQTFTDIVCSYRSA